MKVSCISGKMDCMEKEQRKAKAQWVPQETNGVWESDKFDVKK